MVCVTLPGHNDRSLIYSNSKLVRVESCERERKKGTGRDRNDKEPAGCTSLPFVVKKLKGDQKTNFWLFGQDCREISGFMPAADPDLSLSGVASVRR